MHTIKFDTVIFGKFALDKTPTGKTSFEMRAFIISSVKCRTENKCTCTANPNRTSPRISCQIRQQAVQQISRTISSKFVPIYCSPYICPYSINYSRTYLEICAEINSAVHSPYSSGSVQHLMQISRPYTSKIVQISRTSSWKIVPINAAVLWQLMWPYTSGTVQANTEFFSFKP